MRLATGAGALMAMMALLSGLPAVSHAQNGGWATGKGEVAFSQNRFPELKGLTYSQEDQRKAINLCSQYGGGSQSQLCNLATEFYMKEGQQAADAQRQKETSAATQATAPTEQSSKDEEAPASPIAPQEVAATSLPAASQEVAATPPPIAPQEVAATPSPAAPQEVTATPSQASNDSGAIKLATACSSAESPSRQCADYLRAEKRSAAEAEMQTQRLEKTRLQAQAEAASEQKAKQQEKRDESSALYWKVGILGFLISNVILFVGAAKRKFVVFYDKWDIIHAVLIFVSPACGYFLAWLIDVGTSGESFLHPICIGLGWALAAWFSVVTLISSIRHNKNVTIGIFVGLMKIYTVILIASIALLSFTMLNSNMGSMPKDMDTLEKMQRVKQDKVNGAMWAVLAAGLLYVLVNGAEVYEERGWKLPA